MEKKFDRFLRSVILERRIYSSLNCINSNETQISWVSNPDIRLNLILCNDYEIIDFYLVFWVGLVVKYAQNISTWH